MITASPARKEKFEIRGSLHNYDIPYEGEWGVDVSAFLGLHREIPLADWADG